MQWSAVTWRSASPAQQAPEHRWYGGEAVQPVFSWTLPQALPEASSGVSPSQRTRDRGAWRGVAHPAEPPAQDRKSVV